MCVVAERKYEEKKKSFSLKISSSSSSEGGVFEFSDATAFATTPCTA